MLLIHKAINNTKKYVRTPRLIKINFLDVFLKKNN